MADMTAPIVLLSEQQQQWLDSATENHWLRRIDFQEISNLQMGVASGGFGIVHAGKWRGMPVAIKVLFSLADFIQEVQIHRAVQDFENVVKFYGVTRMRGNGDYGMVLQFAGRGSLRDYLSKHFDKLDWTKKLRLARDVASGINFIHLENICHHDLHSRNVLIDDKGKALITDFGLSRYLNKELSNNGVRGVVPYISPERLKNAPFDKSSDIYSLGVIMWELTSGYPPFDRDGENYMLAFHITTGTREKVIPGTPVEYSELYQKCWDGEPSKRPPLSSILDTLDNLLANRTNGGEGDDGSSRRLEDSHGPPHSLPTVTQTAVISSEPLRKSAPIASKLPAIETTFEGQPSKPVANISPLVPKHNLSRNHPVIVTNSDAGTTVDVVERMYGLRVEDTTERPAGPLITPARPVWMQTPGTPNGGTRHIHPSSPKLPITPPQQSPVKNTPRVGHPLNDPSGTRHSPKNATVSPTIPEMGGGGLESMAEMGNPSVMPLGSPPMPQQRLHQFYPQQQQHQQQHQQQGFHQFQHTFAQSYPSQPMYPPQQHQQQHQQQQHQQQQHQQQYPHAYPPYPYPSSGHTRTALPDPSAYPGFGQANVPFQAYQQASIPATTPARPITISSSGGRVTSNNSNNNWIPLDGKTRIREFFMAALRKSLDAVQWHLDHGADVMERYDNMSGRTPLHAAAMSSSLEVMTLLCEAAGSRLNLNEEDDSGQTPLHLMTHYGTNDSFPVLEYMLEKGANPNAQDSERRTPLMTALTLNDNGQLVETLLDYGADPTIMYLNNNALAEAAIRLRYECVKVLLETDLSMSEPQSLDHAIDGCYRLTDTKNQNRGLILNLLVRWRNNAEGVQRRRTLATLITARSMQLGPRRINRQRLAKQVLESTKSLVHHQGNIALRP